jgi:hypothetical protein
MSLSEVEKSVLQRHLKAVCHLNYAVNAGALPKKQRQLGFILGAGVSYDLDMPGWESLLDAIENELSYVSSNKSGPQSYRGEQLFQFFRKKQLEKSEIQDRDVREASVSTSWREIVSKHLYRKYLKGSQEENLEAFRAAIQGHAYLTELAAIAIDLDVAITHNFDNALEVAVSLTPSERPTNRRFNSFWKPDPFLRPDMLNIYHPNGYIPTAGFKGSDSIVLTEANFADHLANTNNAEASFLLGHLSNKTWLIIGHSLADGTLKNALRLHAGRRPGHVSYFVHFLPEGEKALSVEQREAIREANFSTYNLYTFFLNGEEIGALLRLIRRDPADLKSEIAFCGLPPRFVYYICGAVSSGKSTMLSHLRSFATVEEWPDRMPAAMNKLSVDATSVEKVNIDEKLSHAIFTKNDEIEGIKVGIVAVDRAPLDFIAFPDHIDESPKETAHNRYRKVLRPFIEKDLAGLVVGQVILIETDPKTLLERQTQRGRPPLGEDPKLEKAMGVLKQQQDIMLDVYRSAVEAKSIARGDCCSVAECVQDVVRIIFFNEYQPFDFKGRLDSFLDVGE